MRNVILPIILLIVLATVLVVVACGSAKVSIKVDGFDVGEEEWNVITHELSARLRFEHNCDGPYEFVLIKKQYQFPSDVGVVACDKKWIFSRTIRGMKPGDWKGRLTSSPSASRWVVPDNLDSDTANDGNSDTGKMVTENKGAEEIGADTESDSTPVDNPGDDIAAQKDAESDISADAPPSEPADTADTATGRPDEDSSGK